MKPETTYFGLIIQSFLGKHWWLACGPQAKGAVEVQKNNSLKYNRRFPWSVAHRTSNCTTNFSFFKMKNEKI
jgi:hypothetical protein